MASTAPLEPGDNGLSRRLRAVLTIVPIPLIVLSGVFGPLGASAQSQSSGSQEEKRMYLINVRTKDDVHVELRREYLSSSDWRELVEPIYRNKLQREFNDEGMRFSYTSVAAGQCYVYSTRFESGSKKLYLDVRDTLEQAQDLTARMGGRKIEEVTCYDGGGSSNLIEIAESTCPTPDFDGAARQSVGVEVSHPRGLATVYRMRLVQVNGARAIPIAGSRSVNVNVTFAHRRTEQAAAELAEFQAVNPRPINSELNAVEFDKWEREHKRLERNLDYQVTNMQRQIARGYVSLCGETKQESFIQDLFGRTLRSLTESARCDPLFDTVNRYCGKSTYGGGQR